MREEADRYRAEFDPTAAATMDILSMGEQGDPGVESGAENSEFEKFEDALTELVNTPKAGSPPKD